VASAGEQLEDGAEQGVARGIGGDGAELGHERREARAEGRADGRGGETAQRVDPRPVRASALDLERASVQDRRALLAGRVAELGQQAGLAHTRLAREQHDPGATLRGHPREHLTKAAELSLTADQRRRFAVRDDHGRRRRLRWSEGGGVIRRFGVTRRAHRDAPGPVEASGRRCPQLLEPPFPGAVVLLGFTVAAGRPEQLDEAGAGVFVERVDLHQGAGVADRLVGLPRQAADERAQRTRVEPAQLLPLGDLPRLEVVEVAQVESFEKLTAEAGEQGDERVRGQGLGPVAERVTDGAYVHPHALCVEADAVAVGADAGPAGLVDERPQPTQAPPQGRPRVVGDVPQELAEPFAPVPPPGDHQVRQQRTGLLRLRQGTTPRAASHLRLAQQSDAHVLVLRHESLRNPNSNVETGAY